MSECEYFDAEAERRAFERWIEGIKLSTARDEVDGIYRDDAVEARWDAWIIRAFDGRYLRSYFNAHMEMQAAIDADKFGRAYVKANEARDRLLQIEQESRKG